MKALAWIGGLAWFGVDWARSSLSCRPPAGKTLEEAYRIGVQSLPVLLTISFFVGTNLALQGYNAFVPLGGQRLVGMFVAMAGVRELAPLIAAAMVAAKAGTEMASQIAVMRTREQIDALEVMAVNPYWFLVTPRLYGIILVMPALTLIAVFVTLVSSFLVSVFQLGLNPATFLEFARGSTRMRDIFTGEVKALVFALIICFVSCYCGFVSEKGPEGVGKATNQAVVVSCILCVTFNYLVSQVLYG
ncbi:ABC transporter permease [Deltaproteobacteria bacterium]|nr:ABC transporter permease [Deltaproteobacteria bacterium]